MADGFKKRRRRTGCLTCRTRRVKCDERKPTCERCEAANIDCAGYEEKRHIEVRRPRREIRESHAGRPLRSNARSLTGSSAASTPQGPSPYGITLTARPSFRGDGLPLIGFPHNPRYEQRPVPGARDLLAYHQFLFRTLPLLFAPEHWSFWTDRLCQEAWDTDYAYLALTSLGSMHRSALLATSSRDNDHERANDTKVIAAHTYTSALQALSSQIDRAKASMDITISVLILLAYFECFTGSIPAALGHIQIAVNYFTAIAADSCHLPEASLRALEASLRDLCLVWRSLLPFPRLCALKDGSMSSEAATKTQPEESISGMLRTLRDSTAASSPLENIIWDPMAPYRRDVSKDSLLRLRDQLQEWRTGASRVLPQIDTDAALENTLQFQWDKYPFPVPVYTDLSPKECLAGAFYSFFMGRILWALSLLGEDPSRSERSAYFYFYESLRFVAAQLDGASSEDPENIYVPNETLGVGYLPMLHVIGLCSPRPTWISWIARALREIGSEGLHKGAVLATSLEVLHTFEMCNDKDSPAAIEHFPSPTARVISCLVPETNGRDYVCYFARQRSAVTPSSSTVLYALGHARWTSTGDGRTTKPEIEIYDGRHPNAEQPFTSNWLLNRPEVQAWVLWSRPVEFSLDRALRDHMRGSGLVPPPEGMRV